MSFQKYFLETFGFDPRLISNLPKGTVFFSEQVMYYGLKKKPRVVAWSIDPDDLFPNKINSIKKSKPKTKRGVGDSPSQAFMVALSELHVARVRARNDLIRLTNGSFREIRGGRFEYTLRGLSIKVTPPK